jgi:predicted PurR-regulated permease PerM
VEVVQAQEVSPRRARAAREWAELRARIATTTPRDVARIALVVSVAGGLTWLAAASWPALLPFAIGGVVAYALLPVVDVLDHFMPRVLAAFLSVGAVIVALGAIVLLVVPPILVELVRTGVDVPTAPEIDAAVNRFAASLGTPEGAGQPVVALLAAIAATAKDVLANAQGHVNDIVRAVVSGLLGAVGALIGLIVLPAWMLTVMTNVRRARAAVDQRMAPWIRKDAWAAIAIADRATGAYLRGYVTVALLVGLLTWVGLRASPRLGGPEFREPVALAVLAGVTQLVPVIGALLGLLPGLLLLPVVPDRAGLYVLAYLAARFIGSTILGARLKERRLAVHPAIMVPGIVAIGQFGLIPLLLSAPLVAIVHDLVRYAHGRFSEPPEPAGVLPGTAEAQPASSGAFRRPTARRQFPAPRPLPRAAAEASTAPTSGG